MIWRLFFSSYVFPRIRPKSSTIFFWDSLIWSNLDILDNNLRTLFEKLLHSFSRRTKSNGSVPPDIYIQQMLYYLVVSKRFWKCLNNLKTCFRSPINKVPFFITCFPLFSPPSSSSSFPPSSFSFFYLFERSIWIIKYDHIVKRNYPRDKISVVSLKNKINRIPPSVSISWKLCIGACGRTSNHNRRTFRFPNYHEFCTKIFK